MSTRAIALQLSVAVVTLALIAGCGGGGGPEPGSPCDSGLAPIETTAGGQARVIIGFKEAPGNSEQALVRRVGGKVKRTYHLIPAMAGTIPAAAIDGLRQNPNVAYVEGDAEELLLEDNLVWGVDRIDAEIVWGGIENAVDAPGSAPTGAKVKVGVIDTGIDYNHPDLDKNYAGGCDIWNGDDDPMDDNGHGTMCAGIIAAEDNNLGVVGVAPDTRVYAIKAFGPDATGRTSTTIAGIEWCVDNGMDIASMSFGGPHREAREAACQAAHDAGVLLVAAAGNSGKVQGGGQNVLTPAAYETVIAVAAIDPLDRRAPFSSTGPEVELAAPGVVILAPTTGGGYDQWAGTSCACPHVSGVAALLMEQGMTSADDIRARLQSTARDLGDPGRDKWYGYGLVDAAAALGAIWQPPAPGTEEAVVGGEVRSAQNGHVIEGATVTVVDTGQSRVTRVNGRYFILDVPGGTHTAVCEAPGYQMASQGIDVPDESLQLDWALVPQ
jgi:subtilisin